MDFQLCRDQHFAQGSAILLPPVSLAWFLRKAGAINAVLRAGRLFRTWSWRPGVGKEKVGECLREEKKDKTKMGMGLIITSTGSQGNIYFQLFNPLEEGWPKEASLVCANTTNEMHICPQLWSCDTRKSQDRKGKIQNKRLQVWSCQVASVWSCPKVHTPNHCSSGWDRIGLR